MNSEPAEEIREHEVLSRKLIVALVSVGIFLMWVGQLVVIWSEWEDTEAMKTVYKTSMTLMSLGWMILSGALIGGSILNKSIDKFVRLGMLVVAALIIVQLMGWRVLSFIPWIYLPRALTLIV